MNGTMSEQQARPVSYVEAWQALMDWALEKGCHCPEPCPKQSGDFGDEYRLVDEDDGLIARVVRDEVGRLSVM